MLRKTPILATSSLCLISLSACATSSTAKSEQQINTTQVATFSKQTTENPDFDCDALYANHKTAMNNLRSNQPVEEKSSIFSKIGKSVLSNAGTIAGLAGSNFVQAQRIGDVASIAKSATTANSLTENSQKMTKVFETAASSVEVQRTAYKLALENGCDAEKLNF